MVPRRRSEMDLRKRYVLQMLSGCFLVAFWRHLGDFGTHLGYHWILKENEVQQKKKGASSGSVFHKKSEVSEEQQPRNI